MVKLFQSILCCLVIAAYPVSAATAEDADQVALAIAIDLGSVIGSEAFCELAFDQEQIASFVSERIEASNMEFAGNLIRQTRYWERQVSQMSVSSKSAHCTQTERVARSYGFIE